MKRYNDYIKKTALASELREENDKRAAYYRFWEIHTGKHHNWTNTTYVDNRLKKEQEAKELESEKLHLELRRKMLAEKLHKEAIEYNRELQQLERSSVGSNPLRLQNLELKQKSERDKHAEDELQLYHQWRRDEPAIREAESQFRHKFVREAWADEKTKQDEEMSLRERKMRKKQDEVVAALKESLVIQDEEQHKHAAEQRLAQLSIEEAAEKLRQNQSAIEELHREESIAARLEQDLFRLEKQSQEKETCLNKIQYRAGSGQQVTFRLRQRAAEVQKQLEEDRRLLEEVVRASEQAALRNEKQRLANVVLSKELKALADQVQTEALLANHHANIFSEDATLKLRVLEERWGKEKEARKRLLASVMFERQAEAREMRDRATKQRLQLEEETAALQHLQSEKNDLIISEAEA